MREDEPTQQLWRPGREPSAAPVPDPAADPPATDVLSLDELFSGPSALQPPAEQAAAAPTSPAEPSYPPAAAPAVAPAVAGAATVPPGAPAASGGTTHRLRQDAETVLRQGLAQLRAWLRVGDNGLLAATALVALTLLVTVMAVGG